MYSKQKSLNFGRYVPNDKVLNKKIPDNPKYKHVKPAIDTGKNVQKRIEELKEKQKNINHKKDEVFRRIKVTTFIKLALPAASEFLSNGSDAVNEPDSTETSKVIHSSERRGLTNVVMGIGELDLVNDKRRVRSSLLKPMKVIPPYLLLDVRDRDAFAQCHIITAKHYPSSMLSRSNGYEIEDMKIYKNFPHRIIILYDDDESIAARVATTLVERGYENVLLLTGGLKLVLEFCPTGLTTSSQVPPFFMLSQGASSAVQTNIGKEYFSQEDIDTLQNFVHAYPNRVNNSVWSSKSSQSRHSSSLRSSHRSCLSTSSATRASSTSRYSTTGTEKNYQASSSLKLSQTHPICTKSIEQTRLRPVIDERTRNFKKAPWK